MNTTLQKYIQESELRIVNDNFRIRMSPEIAEKYDSGIYEIGLAEHTACIDELLGLGWVDVIGVKPIIYTYLVPDDRLIELLDYPYKRTRGGRPVQCFDDDGLYSAYGATQNTFIMQARPGIMAHVNNVHEYAHLIQRQLNPYKHVMFQEGFAEAVPWYILDYESKYPDHAMAVLETEIYSANELLTGVSFRDVVEKRSCSFQKSYISSYLFIRALVEQIESKYGVDKIAAIKIYLKKYADTKANRQFLVCEFANVLGIDSDKLLYTIEYQKEILQKIADRLRMNSNFVKPMDNIKR